MINALVAEDLEEPVREGSPRWASTLKTWPPREPEPGLGNGGLGRLAACYVDSLATMRIPAIGTGFATSTESSAKRSSTTGRSRSRQVAGHGEPVGVCSPGDGSDHWLRRSCRRVRERDGDPIRVWVPERHVSTVPYNYLVPGYGDGAVNTLRLWSAQSPDEFNLDIFNAGDYEQTVREQVRAEVLSKVLCPEDSTAQGKGNCDSRSSTSSAPPRSNDFIQYGTPVGFDVRRLPERVIFQLNDTHPVISVPELLRVLIDENGLSWDEAWDITRKCFAYTCHTLMPEALEVWSVDLIEKLLPCHMELIYQINDWFLAEVAASHPKTLRWFTGCRSFRRNHSAEFGWLTWPLLGPARSMAWPNCTANSCETEFSKTSPRTSRTSSRTSRTASPPTAVHARREPRAV